MADVISLSALIRDRSKAAHSHSEGANFMSDLIKGNGTREDYIALVAQHYFMYEALERATERMSHDPVAAAFISDKLTRMPALEADLQFLLGPTWREQIEMVPATRRYVDRINTVGKTWVGGFVAHHYTRYLGDLSGGQWIAKVMSRQFGFDTNGIGFYLFDDIADPAAFKDVYRDQLDSAPWDDDEKERVIEEVLVAYQFNTDVFIDLQRAKEAAAAA